jgi:hypothetical protein
MDPRFLSCLTLTVIRGTPLGRLPRDRERIVATLDRALAGEIPLQPEWLRGLLRSPCQLAIRLRPGATAGPGRNRPPDSVT